MTIWLMEMMVAIDISVTTKTDLNDTSPDHYCQDMIYYRGMTTNFPTATPLPLIRRPVWYRRWWGVALLVIGGLVLAIGFAVLFRTFQLVRQFQDGQITLADLSGQVATASKFSPEQKAALAAAGNYPFLGNPQAPIVIVEFGDFNCPYTKRSVAVLKALVNKYPNEIKIVWRNFAVIDPVTSPLAALAGACAQEQGNLFFWSLHDRLFELEGNLTKDTITQAAKTTGLDINRFSTCLVAQRYASAVRDDITTGIELGVQGTPTFYINGLQVNGHQELANWQKAIASLRP